MRLGTALKGVVLLAAALIVAGIAIVKSIDVNEYRELAAYQVKQATGRELAIRGRLDLSLSLTPALVAEDVVFSNAPGGSRPEMLKVKRVEAEVGLLPLLTGTIEIRRLVLIQPDMLLEVDNHGRGNWQFEGTADAQATAAADAHYSLRIGKVRVEKGQIAWHDNRDGRLILSRLDRLAVDGTSPSSPAAVTASGTVDGHDVDVSGVVGSLAEVYRQSKPFPLKLKVGTKGMVAGVDGSIAELANFDGIDLKVNVEGAEAADAARLAGIDMPGVGPFRVGGRVMGSAARPSLADVDLALGRRDLMLLTAKGTVKELRRLKGLDLSVTADADRPAALSGLLGADLPTAGPVKLSGHLSDDGGAYNLRAIKGSIGKSDLAGEAILTVAAARPSAKIELASASLNLADISSGLAIPAKGDQPKTDAAVTKVVPPVKAPPDPQSPGDRVVPDLALPFDRLGQVDLLAHWTAKKLILNDAVAEDVDAVLEVKDGRLVFKPVLGRVADGRLAADMRVDGKVRPAAVVISLGAEKVQAGALLSNLRLSDGLAGARTDIRAELKANGDNLRDLVAKLDGEVVFVIGSGVVNNTYADLLAFDVLRQIAPWAPKETTTQLQCLVSRFTINDGLAKSRALLFDTANMTMGGNGTVNLADETLDLTLVPRPKQASLINLAVPMNVGGTLASPSVQPNKTALAMGLAGAAAGAVIMPLGVLVPFIATGTGDTNPCIQALAQASARKPSGKARKGQAESVIEGIGGLLKGLAGQ